MGVRVRVGVVLFALVGLSAWHFVPGVVTHVRTSLAVERAGRAVRHVGVPAGFVQCSGDGEAGTTSDLVREQRVGLVCLQGTMTPVRAVVVFGTRLEQLNARSVDARCATRGRMDLCEVDGTVDGQAVDYTFEPQLGPAPAYRQEGVFVSGGSGPWDPLGLHISGGTPVALPEVTT